MRLGQTIDRGVAEAPGRTALVVDGERLSYAELHLLTQRCAATLRGAGVGPGDVVAVVDQGGPLAVASVFAAARLGAAAAQMNPDLKGGEMAALCGMVGCKVGVAGGGYADKLGEALGGTVLTRDDLRDAPAGSMVTDPPIEAGSTGLILFSSGSTGLPKPVYISHRTMVDRLANYGTRLVPEGDPPVDMISVPLFHIGGALGLLITLYSGRTTVVLPRFEAGAWLRTVEEYRVNQTFIVPTMLRRILDHPDFAVRDISSLRSLSYGAAPAPPDLITRAVAALPGVDFSNTFGQTETLGAYAALSPDDHRAGRKLDSVGRPFPGVEVRVVDVVTHEDVGTGQVGEAVVRSAQNITSEWMPTGDLVLFDEEGYLYVKGRLKDTINRGGEKFGPIEIETAIRTLHGVVEVAVAGVPDDELGERVGALVVGDGSLGAAEVRAHCQEVLARYKVPELIFFVDELPYNRYGKLPRAAVVEAILSRAG